jgi:hypothetical protein
METHGLLLAAPQEIASEAMVRSLLSNKNVLFTDYLLVNITETILVLAMGTYMEKREPQNRTD